MEAMAQIHLQQCFFDQTISISIPIAIKIFSTQSEFRFGRTTEQTAINNWQIHHSEDSKFRFGRTTDRQPVSLQNNHLAPAIINPPPPPTPPPHKPPLPATLQSKSFNPTTMPRLVSSGNNEIDPALLNQEDYKITLIQLLREINETEDTYGHKECLSILANIIARVLRVIETTELHLQNGS